MTIIDAFVVEHALLRGLFDQIERDLKGAVTLAEVRMLARLIEGLLLRHGGQEEDLVFAALDHVLEHRGERDRFYRDHQELDGSFKRVHASEQLPEACRLLKAAIRATRKHFSHEEEFLFPLVSRVLAKDSLIRLGESLRGESRSLAC